MKIDSVCTSLDEAARLHAAIADFSRDGDRAHYAEWLDARGDTGRADTVRATIEAYHSLDASCLDNLSGADDWLRMTAAPLIKMFIQDSGAYNINDLLKLRDLTFARLRPALSLSYSLATEEPRIGSSYLWGQPDLPEGEVWPTIAETSDWFGAKKDLPLDNHCAFIGQISFQDLLGTVLGQELPSSGGFSVFSITETENFGVVENVIRPFSNHDTLTRRAAPGDLAIDKLGNSINSPIPFYTIELKETLSLPDATCGPFSEEIHNCKSGDMFYDFYYDILTACSDSVLGLGGYLKCTGGCDPSPAVNFIRLAVLRTTPNAGMIHFAIPADDLKEGRLEPAQYVWNDWDS